MLIIPVWTVYLHYLSSCSDSGYLVIDPGRNAIFHLIALTMIFKGVYVLNQVFDIESDRKNDKLFFLPRDIISLRSAWIYYLALTLVGLVIVSVFAPKTITIAFTIVILGVAYSAPKMRMKDNAFGGLMSNAVAYGIMIPWMVGLSCTGRMVGLTAVPYFLAIAAGYVLTTIPDHNGDAATGKTTVSVILGPKGALILAHMLSLATAAVSLWVQNFEMIVVSGVTLVCVTYLLASFKFTALNFACKFPILLMTLLAGLHYPIYIAVLLLTIILTRWYYKKRFGIIYPKLG
jgi:4-hydroxybenzoate polyprenyltransferase